MHRIDSPGATPDNRFTEGDPVAAVPATEVTADWLNAVQEEVAAVIEGAAIELDKEDNGQLLQAIRDLIADAEQTGLTDHQNDVGAHGATSAAAANRIIMRDANGRAKVAAPSAADDIARKAEVDAVIPPGTRMVFYQASAPTGWTKVVTVSDRVLRVTSGVGGGSGGSWTLSGLSASVSVGATTLSVSQMPSHNHDLYVQTANDNRWPRDNSGVQGVEINKGGMSWVATPVGSRGGGGAHTHSASATITNNGNWRPAYIDVIVCEKDA